jgi:nitric oxide reductase NorD protein
MAESLSELPEARLVTTPGRPRELLLSDEPPDTSTSKKAGTTGMATASVSYPEWDYRIRAYREPGRQSG